MSKQEITSLDISEIIDELTDRLDISEKLIFILKKANAEKDKLINKQSSELVFLNNQKKTRDLFIEKIKDMVC